MTPSYALSCLLFSVIAAVFPARSESLDGAQDLFTSYGNGVVQVRVSERETGSKAGIGSGFFVSPQGLVLTNFHVISEVLYHPQRYLAQVTLGNGHQGELTVLALDVINDLALLKADTPATVHFDLARTDPRQGDRLYSLGNPHDLGLSIVEGTYNGYVDNSLYKKIHFTGAINAGMSGGPVVDRRGRVVGINVASSGNQIGFLVPVRYARRLIKKMEKTRPGSADFLAVIREQMLRNQAEYLRRLLRSPLPTMRISGHTVPGNLGAFMKCWGDAVQRKHVLYKHVYQACSTNDTIYLSSDLSSGSIEYRHDLYLAEGLDPIRFSGLLEKHLGSPKISLDSNEEMVTNYACHTGMLEHRKTGSKAVFCLRAYRRFKGLYDAFLTAMVPVSDAVALQTTLLLSGVSYEYATRFAHAYMDAIRWDR
ncbi:MAG: S1C family serine protease [Gammaproteobacteria bacterium]